MPQIHIGVDIPTNRAIDMLIAAGAGTVAFIGIVFSLLFLVVQFGSTAFSPRLNLFRDAPIVWRTFSFYTGVVVYSLTAALVIGRDEKTSSSVPIVAFVAVLASIILYRQLQIGAFKSIQLSSTLAQVAHRGRVVIDGLYVPQAPATSPIDQPRSANIPSADGHVLREIRWPRRAAIVQVIDVPRVLRAAERARRDPVQGGIRRDDRRRSHPSRRERRNRRAARARDFQGVHGRRGADVRAGPCARDSIACRHRTASTLAGHQRPNHSNAGDTPPSKDSPPELELDLLFTAAWVKDPSDSLTPRDRRLA
jgi:Predicted membrane protein (DUF2254)